MLNKHLAKAKSVMIGMENVDYFMPLDRFKLLDELELEHIGIALDVGHAMFKNIGIPVVPSEVVGYEPFGSIEGFIEEFGPKIIHVHVHDFKEGKDHLPVGQGEIDFASIIAALKESGYERALCLELAVDEATPKDLLGSKKRLREWIGE